jgi:hypothetical protein
MTDVVLQLHKRPQFLATRTLLHLNIPHLFMKVFLNQVPLSRWKETRILGDRSIDRSIEKVREQVV